MLDFNQIYSDNHKIILNYVNLKINDSLVAEELTNDVFMRVHKHLDRFDSEKSAMKTWVMNIAKNIVIDHYRKAKLETLSLDQSNDSESDNVGIRIMDRVSSTSNPYKEMVSNESMHVIQKEISSLSKKYRKVAKLFFNEELSYDEISERLHLPLNTVKVRLNRARKQLVTKLETVKV